jgi:hypothetical protein
MSIRTLAVIATLAVAFLSCSSDPRCIPPGSRANDPYHSQHSHLFRSSCEHVVLSLGPFCVRRLAGAILAGPQPNNRWGASGSEPTDPWLELIGPLPEASHRVYQLSDQGAFDFGPLPAGQYLLKASACGWQSAYFFVVVSPSAPARARIQVELPLGV